MAVTRGWLLLLAPTVISGWISPSPSCIGRDSLKRFVHSGPGSLSDLPLGRQSVRDHRPITCQVEQWVTGAAQKQKRNPILLSPRPLYSNIMVRPASNDGVPSTASACILPPGWVELKDDATQTNYYWNEATGVTQWEMPPSHTASRTVQSSAATEMDVVSQFLKELPGKPKIESIENTLVAEDTMTGEIVGCAQLGRLELSNKVRKDYQFIAPTVEEAATPRKPGGVFLVNDQEIKNIFVKPEYRSIGIANNLVHGLLSRLGPDQRAWAFAPSRESTAFGFLFSAGFVGLTFQECSQVFPSFLWPLLRPFQAQKAAYPGTIFFAAEGRGAAPASRGAAPASAGRR